MTLCETVKGENGVFRRKVLLQCRRRRAFPALKSDRKLLEGPRHSSPARSTQVCPTSCAQNHLDTHEGHPDYPSQLYSLQKMYDALNKLPVREVVVMLDSCFSGAKGRSITGEGTRPVSISIENPVLAGGKIVVIAASSGSQMSSDYDKVKHGLFTYYLLRGMRGEASMYFSYSLITFLNRR